MRKRIYRISEDRFDDVLYGIEFDRDEVHIEIGQGQQASGSFLIKAEEGGSLRGIVYSSNPYITVENPDFDSASVTIRFTAATENFLPGERLTGVFHVVCAGQTAELPVEILVSETTGRVGSFDFGGLSDFAKLAREKSRDALSLFSSADFLEFLKHVAPEHILLYRSLLSSVGATYESMEHFLSRAGVKEEVKLHVFPGQTVFYHITENLKEKINITRNTWGFFHVKATVLEEDGFLTLESSDISPDFFMGQSMELSYYIHADRLHEGMNCSTISFDGPGFHEKLTIMASTYAKDERHNQKTLAQKAEKVRLVSNYLSFRLNQMTMGDWSDDVISSMNKRLVEDPSELFAQLYKAQALIVSGRRQEGLWIISDLKKIIEDKSSFEWAYLLYLCTLIEPEVSYVDRLTGEIEGIFRQHPEDMRLFWFLLFLRVEYLTDTRRKLKDIWQWIRSGIDSPILYVEALDGLRQDPFLLRQLDPISLRVLWFGVRRNAISENLAIQIPKCLVQERVFSRSIFTFVTSLYERMPSEDLLDEILSYLLRCRCLGEPFAKWYLLGIEKEKKLSGLFEAYLYCLKESDTQKLPRLLLMYFSYENRLPYDRRAFLYANVVIYKAQHPKIYEAYQKQMERFALEQMHQLRMDDNLAILYQDLISRGFIDEEESSNFGQLFFVKKLICLKEVKGRLYVFDERFQEPQVVELKDHTAYVSASTPNLRFVLDTGSGILCGEDDFYLEPLLSGEENYNRLRSLAKDDYNYFLHDLCDKKKEEDFSLGDITSIFSFFKDQRLSKEFVDQYVPLFIRVLKKYQKLEEIAPQIMAMDPVKSSLVLRLEIVEQLITHDRFDKALKILRQINGLAVPMNLLLRLVSGSIKRVREVDDFLVKLAAYLLDHFLSDEQLLEYLTTYYTGPTRTMITVFQYALARQLHVHDLCERILIQMIYEGSYYDKAPEIFSMYRKGNVNRMLQEAYLTYSCRLYLLSDQKLSEDVIEMLSELLRRGIHLNDTCRVALMKHLAGKGHLEDREEYRLLSELLRESVLRGQYFSFYRQIDPELVVHYHLYDRLFAEYHGKRGLRLQILVQRDGKEEETLELTEMYDGVYVRDFVLFFGESIKYKIVTADDHEILQEDTMVYMDVIDHGKGSRYGRINRMESDLLYQNNQQLVKEMQEYHMLDSAVRELFPVL
ncbi:MAG: hypothetical protein IIU28_05180 [Lachnospiraceae bacterium]|nr:hypothetical protein [Lachnospiraceae bacterium]